jgi:uncharacterized membrane protein YhaH (DUF805 family)
MYAWVAHCFKNYAVFKGRASRPEYWWLWLFLFVVSSLTLFLKPVSLRFYYGVSTVVAVLTVIPQLAAASRRLHDTEHSFWWIVVPILPILPLVALGLIKPSELKGAPAAIGIMGFLLLALLLAIRVQILLARKGTPGPNRYGDPAPTSPGSRIH